MKEKIFVYGTLRKGMYNHDLYLKDKNIFKGIGFIKGKLMTLKDKNYPALLLEGDDLILGEIYEVDRNIVDLLDELESYFGENNLDNEYNKIVCDIFSDDGKIIDRIPVYVYNTNNPVNMMLLNEVISNGDFVRYSQNI
ncbi:MAG: gamma-glutamylcyclotransferase [Thomasclavelia sp.]|uniref:gamma-glutamylcyclotransferase family protein n=1 Tax=Thomasclavelia sp. TaxID=3025757 RepID=UPI0039A0806C